MNKSDLRKLVKIIVTEINAAKKACLSEATAFSGNTKASDKKDNTEMKSDAKSITSTDKPVEKEGGKKLPVKDSAKNTETDHTETNSGTPAVPASSADEKARPAGGHAAKKDGGMKSNGLKEDITTMIREALEAHRVNEMAKKAVAFDGKTLSGSISNSLRVKDSKSPTGWALSVAYKMKDGKVVPAGVPVDAPAMTGKNYVSKGIAGMGRPKATPTASDADGSGPIGLDVSVELDGETTPLDFDFLNSTWPKAKSFIESEVMANLGDSALDPNVKIGQEVYTAIEKAKENDLDGKLNASNNKVELFFDTASKQLKVKTAGSAAPAPSNSPSDGTADADAAAVKASAMAENDDDDDGGYDRNDPKHPTWMDRKADAADRYRSARRDTEDGADSHEERAALKAKGMAENYDEDEDEDSGYDRNDPKHPSWLDRNIALAERASDEQRDSAAEKALNDKLKKFGQ